MPLPELRALDRRVWSLALARLIVTAGFSMVLPFLAMHLAIERRIPATIIGVIWTSAGAAGALSQWAAGALSDRVGRRPVMLAALLLRTGNLVALGYATAAHAPVLVIALLTVGNAALRSFFDPVANALVIDLSPPERRVVAFSVQRVGVNIGWAAGPALAAMAERAGVAYSTLFYWGAPLTFAAAVAVGLIRDAGAGAALPALRWPDLLAFRKDRAFVLFLLATAAFFLLQVQLYQTLSIYAARVLGLSRAQVGDLYTLNGVLVVFLQLPAVRAIRRLGTRRALVLGCIGYATAYAAVGLTVGHGSLLLAVGAVTLAEILTAPAQQTSMAALAPEGRIGTYSGLFGLSQIAGQSVGPLVGTAVLDALPARTAWFVLAFFALAAAVGYTRARPSKTLARGGTT